MELHRPFSIITPTLDGDVLAILARSDATFTTGQLHRLLPHVSQEGIRLVAQRLGRQGILTVDRVGNTFTYRLNREHVAASSLIAIADLMGAFLARLTDRLAEWDPQPAYGAVFGSAARGEMSTSSDIDVLLVRPAGADETVWDAQVQELARDITRWTGNDARPLVMDESDIRPGEPVLHDVTAHGLTVAGTHDWLARRLRKTKATT